MSIRIVNFQLARLIYEELYDEIYNTKSSKIHFNLFGDDERDGVVDGARDKWKNISFMDALMSLSIGQCPDAPGRSFNQFKCTKYSILMSSIANNHYQYIKYSNNKIGSPIKYSDFEIHNMPAQFLSARAFINYLIPNYRTVTERTRQKMTRQFFYQLKALLPDFKTNAKLNFIDKLDYLISEIDKNKLFTEAITRTIRSSLEYDGDDFILKHWEIIEELVDSLKNSKISQKNFAKSKETVVVANDNFVNSKRKYKSHPNKSKKKIKTTTGNHRAVKVKSNKKSKVITQILYRDEDNADHGFRNENNFFDDFSLFSEIELNGVKDFIPIKDGEILDYCRVESDEVNNNDFMTVFDEDYQYKRIFTVDNW